MGTQLTPRIQAWKDRGYREDFRNYNIHCFYQEGNGNGPLHVICHGYPTCSYDWVKVIDLLPTKEFLTFDFLGFGLSDKPPNHDYTLAWQADLVEELLIRHEKKYAKKYTKGMDVILIARDLEHSLNPKIKLVGSFLFNGSMFMERANLILGQKVLRSFAGPWLARFTFSSLFRWQLGSVFSRSLPLSQEEGEDQWALMSLQNGHKINDKLIRYTFERVEKAERWLGAVKNWDKPIAYAWGMQDPVCGAWQWEGWRELRPNADITEMQDLGHYPQIEDPAAFTKVMQSSMEKIMQ
ncbi:Mesoderm-specific transcript protein [Folsomia candida]|uniref:Mesoderm-specific transcript protein n=1 Tax=Folsomia candida TaxID=158441 RepID=A0A226D2M7_FOLCA|nr:Mesoderm-specific transcript protein [Folsomia candida]